MMPWNANSLRSRLTWRLAALQAAVLIGFAAVAAIPVAGLINDQRGIDASVYEDIAASLEADAAGRLHAPVDSEAAHLATKYPDLWYHAVDAEGRSVQHGAVPADVSGLVTELPRLSSAYLPGIGPGGSEAVIRRADREVGPVWILGGGGPQMRLRTALAAFGNPVFLGLLASLTAASFLFIPILVRRQLRGVNAVAAEADTIDVDKRGMRLSTSHVPDELHSLVAAVNAALQRLDDGIERRQRFLADAAHELRTPIAILQTRLELLPDDASRSRLLLDVARLTNLANQLLDLQRLDADKTTLQPVNLVDIAAQVSADLAPLVIAAGDEIAFEAEADTVTVCADAASMSRALTNLIQNAVIHGGSSNTIRVGVRRNGSLLVTDTGPGIAKEHRSTIFEPFGRVLPLDHGAGLGLSLVSDIVHKHKGRITVGDAPGGGARFEISLPLVASA